MIKLSHSTLIMISGLIWLLAGGFLLQLGLGLLVGGTQPDFMILASNYPLLNLLTPFLGSKENSVLLLIAVSLYVGYLKGRHVLGKSAHKGVARIQGFANPTSLGNIYSPKYYILLGAMVGLGMSIKFLGIPNDVRGAIDVTIGSALINGAIIYFRCLGKKKTPKEA